MSATHPHLSSPVVLCVESEDSGLATSSVVFNSGDFRVISATNPTTALKALTVLRVDAVVSDVQALPEQGFDLGQRLRQIAPTVPHVLVCPSSAIKESADPARMTYIVHPDTLVSRPKTLLQQTVAGAAQVHNSAERSWPLLTAQQELWEELRLQMGRLKSAVRRRTGGPAEKTQDNANLEPSRFAVFNCQTGSRFQLAPAVGLSWRSRTRLPIWKLGSEITALTKRRVEAIDVTRCRIKLLAGHAVMLKKVANQVNRNGVDALKIDLEAGLTRALIASQAPEHSAKRVRNQREARKAFDSVAHFMKRVTLTPADAQEIEDKLAHLKSALERLGDSF